MTEEDCFCRFIGPTGDVTVENAAELNRSLCRGGELSRMGKTHADVADVQDKDMAVFGSGCEICDKPDQREDRADTMDHHEGW